MDGEFLQEEQDIYLEKT